MKPIQHKFNNSYDSEPSSSNGSINDALATETIPPPLNFNLPDLFAVSNIANESILNNMSDIQCTSNNHYAISKPEANDFDSQITQYSLNSSASTEISDQNERVLKDLDKFKLTKILKTLTSNQSSCLPEQYSCDENIHNSTSIMFNMENSSNASDSKISNGSSYARCDKDLSFRLNIAKTFQDVTTVPTSASTDINVPERKNTSFQCYERSPDLFADYYSDEETNNRSVFEDVTTSFLESSDMANKSKTSDWERLLLKRLQTSLSGVLPPPSKTIIQYNIAELLTMYDENVQKMSACDTAILTETESLFKPSRTVEQIKNIKWEDMTADVKCHGVHYNRTNYSENIELLGMKYVERCVGVETSSSFTHDWRPSINKNRVKLLKSPGTRLSHLVRRKRTFSNVNLMSKQCGDSSKLGSKQLVIDVQKYDKRKRKITTPKRRTPAKKRTPGRKTPGSSRKRMTLPSKSMNPTRETSKRALFQSPPKQKLKLSIPVEVARRVDKSKRMLFSPQSKQFTNNKSEMKESISQVSCGKRRRDEDGLLGNQSKIPRIGMNGCENVTPRSMLTKSQTVCVTKPTNNDLKINGTTVNRASSDATLNGSQPLSQSHRRKLLWAVSTALRNKNINSQHPNFTAFATVLAKVVKRFFLETRNVSVSTSDTMIKIADRHVFWVMKGKTVDEIYLNEKMRKENLKATYQSKLSGYIAPDEYEKLKKPLPKTNSNMFLSQSSMDSFGFSQNSYHFNMESQSSTLSQYTESLLGDLSVSNCFMEPQTQSLNSNSETASNNNVLCSSSSKNNNSGSVLRENVRECELKQKSGQKLIEFSGKNQKNVSPYHDNKLVLGGGSRTNIKNVKRQISFDA